MTKNVNYILVGGPSSRQVDIIKLSSGEILYGSDFTIQDFFVADKLASHELV